MMQVVTKPDSVLGIAKRVQARDAILLGELPHVKFIARKIHERLPQHIDLQDLIHAGILGLLDALKKYDGGRNVQFKSYAQFRIRGAILDSLRELDWGPRQLRKQARRIEEARVSLTARLGSPALDEEIACEIGMSLKGFQSLSGELRGLDLLSIQTESSDDFYSQNLDYSNFADPTSETPYELCARSEMERILREALAELPGREAQMLVLYYFEELTMKQIGMLFGVVESRISQMHAAVILRLRPRLKGLREHTRHPRKATTSLSRCGS